MSVAKAKANKSTVWTELPHFHSCLSLFFLLFVFSLNTATPQSLDLQVPAFHSSDLLIHSSLQSFDRFVHADVPTPRAHRKT
jgi:hypothetical protein